MNPHNMRNRPTRDRYTATLQYPEGDLKVDDQFGEAVRTIDHTVEITPADQLRAEIVGHQQGLGPMSDAPLHYTVVWIWCALTRTGLYDQDWRTFVNRDLYAWGPADAFDTDEAGGEGDSDPMAPPVRFEAG